MNEFEKMRDLVRLVTELRRMHTVYSRPWDRHQRSAVERCEREVDELLASLPAEEVMVNMPAATTHQ